MNAPYFGEAAPIYDPTAGGLIIARHAPELAGHPRSPDWPATERAHLKWQSTCQACGCDKDLNVHHIKPYHLLPDLELVDENLITLCRVCHFYFGHWKNWTSWNPDVVKWAADYLAGITHRPKGDIPCSLPF